MLVALGSYAAYQVPSLAAGGLLYPARRAVTARPNIPFDTLAIDAGDVRLSGWRFPARGERRATLIYLHGIADNRASGIGIAERFTRLGYDVLAYDSRAHGESDGDVCTYGYYEKGDLSRVLDGIDLRPIILLGGSLGAAVALQAAAEDPRIAAVVAAETFADLRTVATERAPAFMSAGMVRRAFAIAERLGSFRVDEVSPVQSARRTRVPVLLIHGAVDRETPPEHSRRVFEALAGPKRLIVVPGAGHNQSLSDDVLDDVEAWLRDALAG